MSLLKLAGRAHAAASTLLEKSEALVGAALAREFVILDKRSGTLRKRLLSLRSQYIDDRNAITQRRIDVVHTAFEQESRDQAILRDLLEADEGAVLEAMEAINDRLRVCQATQEVFTTSAA
jgi:hypothetical protein